MHDPRWNADKYHRPDRSFFEHRRIPHTPPFGVPPMRFEEQIETKEDAIDFLEIQKKRIAHNRRRMQKRINHFEMIENLLDEKISEVLKQDNYSPDEMKRLLRKTFHEIDKKILDEED